MGYTNVVSDEIFHIACDLNILWGLWDLTAVPRDVLSSVSWQTLDFPRMFYGKCAGVWNIYNPVKAFTRQFLDLC